MATTTWALKPVLFLIATISSHDAWWRRTKVFIIVTWHNQLSNSWTKTLLRMKLFKLELKRRQTMTLYSVKLQTNKVKILALKYTSLPGKSQRLKVGFGLLRNIFIYCWNLSKGTYPKLDGNFEAEVKLPTSLHTSAWTISTNHPFLFHKN